MKRIDFKKEMILSLIRSKIFQASEFATANSDAILWIQEG